jgi:hypothetical protein
MKHVTAPALAFVIVAMLMVGISAASAQTATPTATVTITPFGTPVMTATPTPTSTPRPAYTFNDYHFLNPDGPWVASSSSVEWSPSRFKIPSGQSISQTVSYITDTFPVTISLRLAAPTTSTVDLYMGIKIKSLTITSTRLATYSFTETVTFPKTVRLAVSDGGPVTVDAIGFRRADGDLGSPFDPGGAYENPLQEAGSVDISGMVEWFTPLTLTPKFTLEFDTDWTATMRIVARLAATLLAIATPQIMNYYIAGRISITCVLWFFGFVMQKIGKPIPNTGQAVVVLGSRQNVPALPKLPSSGLRGGGRRRRSRW